MHPPVGLQSVTVPDMAMVKFYGKFGEGLTHPVPRLV